MPGEADPDRLEVRARWEETFGSPPSPYTSVGFMRRALHHDAQCRRSGGLPASTRRALRRIAEGRAVAEAGGGGLRPGAHLVREWNGRSYQVEVVAEGFRLDGRTYRSLSAVARQITGTAWSGPRFFGLAARS
ncbi:MAG: DUF2924 domain-containing protein [Pseudooceanicola sp.]